MQLIPLRITALAPLTFPTRKPGTQFRASLPYVPGAAIYGALGMWFGNHGNIDSELFRQMRCHNAYPARSDDPWVRPLPATAIQPKGHEERGLSHDSLVERVCWEQQEPSALIYAPTDADGRPWEAVGPRFYTLGCDPFRSVQQRALTRVSINRRRGTAEDQRLYSLLALDEVTGGAPTQFLGSLICPDGRAEELQDAVEKITHLGGRQTTGLGTVKLDMANNQNLTETWQDIQKRVVSMTKRFQAQTALYQELGGRSWPIADESIFTVNLLSDAILLDQGWLPTNEFSSQMLEEVTGIKAMLRRAFTTTSVVGGWNVVWQRPKQTDVAVTMGSLFVFQAEGSLTAADYQKLAELQLDGIGERRSEGYGQVRICDDFHLIEVEELR